LQGKRFLYFTRRPKPSQGRGADAWLTSSAAVMNVKNCTSTSPYFFMSLYFIEHKNRSTVAYRNMSMDNNFSYIKDIAILLSVTYFVPFLVLPAEGSTVFISDFYYPPRPSCYCSSQCALLCSSSILADT
jgi:hypothetical protein